LEQGKLFSEFPIVDKLQRATGATKVRFDGADYSPKRDDVRLSGQLLRIFLLMRDGRWRTLEHIAEHTGDPAPSVSAQLRHLRKKRFGEHIVNRRHLGNGLYEYQVVVSGK